MAKLLKLRRGTTSQHSSFTGAEGEVTVDTTKDTLVVHDGSTAGGTPLAKESALNAINTDLVNDTTPQLGGNLDVNTKNITFGDSSDGATDDVLTFGVGAGGVPDLSVYSNGSEGILATQDGGTIKIKDGSNTMVTFAGASNQIDFGVQCTFAGNSSNASWDKANSRFNANVQGNLTGNVTGDVTGDLTGTADLATEVTVTANNSTDETVYPVFVDGATGSQGAETDTGLTYNPSTGLLTSTSFAGNLTGNVTGNASGSSGSCTGNAATATTATTATNVTVAQESTDTTCNVIFTTAIAGDLPPKANSKLSFNSATGTLNADYLTHKIGGVQWDVRDVYWGGTNSGMTHDYTLRGRCMGIGGTTPIAGGGWSGGNVLTLINTGSSNATITESGCTLYWTADGTSGTRTLGPRGMCTLFWVSSTVAYIGGGGLS